MATDFDPELVPQDGNAATKVFKNFFVQLMEGIQDTDKLAVELYADDVIVRTTRDQVTQITLTREQKNTKLLAAVESQLHVSPKAFEVFLYALRERTTLNDICRRMEEAYRQPSAVARSTSSEPDSFSQNQLLSPASGSENDNSTFHVPNDVSRAFPYLDMGKMTERQQYVLQCKLLKDSDNIMSEFSDVNHYTIVSLNANPEVTVEILSARVASLGAYKPVRAQKPLLRDQLKEIRACSTIDGIFCILQEYYSFFNYGIIQRIVTWFGMPADERRLEEYTKHFKEFCKRRTFECPPDVYGHASESDVKSALVLKIGDSLDLREETQGKVLDQVLRLQNSLAEVLKVECETLYLRRIDKGCVELKFQVPSFIQRDIFPLSLEQERSLIKIGVASLICGSYKFSRQVLTIEDDSSNILEEALKNIGGWEGDSSEEDFGDVKVNRQQENSDSKQKQLPAVCENRTLSERPSLKAVIEDHNLFRMFQKFLKDRCITRNLDFWLACEHFRQVPSRDDQEHLIEVGRAIYTNFIKMSAGQHVTILDLTKRNIFNSLYLCIQVTPQLFTTAQQEIFEVLEKNEFRQFFVSGHCSGIESQVSAAVYSPSMADPAYGVCGGGSLQQSGSEDSASLTSLTNSIDSEAKHCSSRNAMSDAESSRHNKPQQAGPKISKSKTVTQEEFGVLLYDSLQAVQMDRAAMAMKARDRAREQGKSYKEIMDIEWYDLPEAAKYIKFEPSIPSSEAKQVVKKSWSHKPTGNAYSSSILHTTSDFRLGDTLATSDLTDLSNRTSDSGLGNTQDTSSRTSDSGLRNTQSSNSHTSDSRLRNTQSSSSHTSDSRLRNTQSSSNSYSTQRYPNHRLTTPKRSRLVHSHEPAPLSIAERGMTPQRQSEDILVVYHLDDFPTPYAMRIRGMEITLAEFKEKVFARKGDFRYFFKSFCEELGMEIMEEYSDDAALLPHTQGKIVGRVETVT